MAGGRVRVSMIPVTCEEGSEEEEEEEGDDKGVGF